MRIPARALFALGAAAILVPGMASAITVDGLIGDWGVTIPDTGSGNNAATHRADYTGVTGTPWENSHFEGDGYTTPGSGGQNYDVEFMALHIEGNMLYGSILSGQRADNGATRFSPGDIFLEAYDANLGVNVTFAIEVGAGGSAGATWDLDGSGYTTGSSPSFYSAGEIVRDPNYVGGQPFNSPSTHGDKIQLIGGSAAIGSAAQFVFNQNAALGEHSIIEFAINLDLLDLGIGGELYGGHWGPSCGNDVAVATPSSAIPEPSAALLMFVGMFTIRSRVLGRREV